MDLSEKQAAEATRPTGPDANSADDEHVGSSIAPPTAEEEARVIRKLDWYLMPVIFLMYMLSVLDRSNLGNAYTAGLGDSLDLSGYRYNWLGTAFYISYILCQWTAVGWKQFRPHIWLACVVLTWATISSCQAAVQNYGGLVALRVILGASEAMYAGAPLYLSFFYPRDRLGLRQAVFASAGSLANAYGGALGYAILSIQSRLASWRILFLVEGLPGLLVVAVAFFLIPDEISTARFLDGREREVAIDMVRRGQRADVDFDDDENTARARRGTRWREFFQAFADWHSYLPGVMYFVTQVAFSSLPLFVPQIIADMGVFSSQQSNGLSAPPYLFTFLLTLAIAWVSDRMQLRGPFIVLFGLVGAVGFLLLALTSAPGPRYLGVFLAVTTFVDIAILLPWMSNIHATESKRAGGWAIFATLGQVGPLVGTNIYTSNDAPYYRRGSWIAFALSLLLAVVGALFSILLHLENKKMDKRDASAGEQLREERQEDEHGVDRAFRYII